MEFNNVRTLHFTAYANHIAADETPQIQETYS